MVHPDFNRKAGVVVVEPREKRRHLWPRHMRGNAEAETAARRGKACQCTIVSREKFAGGCEKHRPLGGQAHRTRCSFEQPLTKPVFQSFELDADGALGGAQRFGGAGEALQISDGDEGLDGFHIQRAHFGHSNLLSLKYSIIQFRYGQALTSLPLVY